MNVGVASHRLTASLTESLDHFEPVEVTGRVIEAVGTVLRVAGLRACVGELCVLHDSGSQRERLGEVIGFSAAYTLVTPFGSLEGLSRGTDVRATGRAHDIQMSDHLLGRTIDGFGAPIDGLGALPPGEPRPLFAAPPPPFARVSITKPLQTGVRAIDGMLTIGEGQRVGIFAAAGVGKSTLLGMLARGTPSEVHVIALVGERGREVRDFVEQHLGEDVLRRSVLVVATSDRPAMERVKCALTATAVAEYFRERGNRVLLLVDSLTRFARAQREIGLAAGEPPTRRGFPPSLFSALPQLLERAGTDGRGSITAFYTVLTEGEDLVDPVAEEVRAILDGHIILSQQIATQARFPAIDVLRSKSRLMSAVAGDKHLAAAREVIAMLAKYQEIEFLIQVGEFKRGENRLADRAAAMIDSLRAFLAQPEEQLDPFSETVSRLQRLAGVS